MKLFPIPDTNKTLWIEYIYSEDRYKNDVISDVISSPSNVPYGVIPYSSINQPGKTWIRKYCEAMSKVSLGLIRSKFASLPIPDNEITLDGDTLRSEGREEMTELVTELREQLEKLTAENQMEKTNAISEGLQNELSYIPETMPIIIG